ncbi:MAG: hypothetical protein ACK553_04540 [Planctomycetota bacterium]|jgi:hypothetical protein
MKLRRTDLFKTRLGAPIALGGLWIGLAVGASAGAQEVRIQIPLGAEVQVQIAGDFPVEGNENRAEMAQRWIRGFIQNELNLIERVCKPSSEEAQLLVDVAETEWKSRMANAIRTYAEAQHQRVKTDFDSRVERLVQIWVRDLLPEDKQQLWQKEVDTRLAYRKQIVIGRMVEETERKFGLTHAQMNEVTELLNERWKDSWWSMYRSGTMPETKFAWVGKVLSESQRTLGGDRTTQAVETFAGGGFVDMPSLDLKERFRIGAVSSSPEIPLHTKRSGDERQDNTALPIDQLGPKIFDPNLPFKWEREP